MINLNGIMSPNNHMDRAMGFIAVGATLLSTGVGMYQTNQNKLEKMLVYFKKVVI